MLENAADDPLMSEDREDESSELESSSSTSLSVDDESSCSSFCDDCRYSLLSWRNSSTLLLRSGGY